MIPIIKLKKGEQLYYGGDTDFWHDTVNSLINSSLYGATYATTVFRVIEIFIVVIIFFALFLTFLGVFNPLSVNSPITNGTIIPSISTSPLKISPFLIKVNT